MITSRGILLLGVFALLLSGCSNKRCPPPDALSSLDPTPCYYKLTITEADASKGYVIGKYSPDLIKDGASPDARFVVPVTDLATLLLQGKIVTDRTYEFTNGQGSFLNSKTLREAPDEQEDEYKTK